MSYEYVKTYRRRLKERAIYVLGDKCQICGYNKCLSALEFHHLDPESKDFTFSQNTNKSWESVNKELKKCILVCANCHREIHANLIENAELKSSYDKNKAEEITILVNNIKEKKIFLCKYCGQEVTKGNNVCTKCSSELRRKVERPTREELKFLIRTMPFIKIAEKYEVSDNAIRKWCDTYGLPRKKSDIKAYSQEEWDLI